ncbi:MAG: M28 family metallopeptidase [Armatimonadota bacterium]
MPDQLTATGRAALRTVRVLAEDIGPRLAGSGGERRAANWLAEQLEQAGCDVAIEPFSTPATFVSLYALLTVLGGAALPLAWWSPLAGLVAGLTAGLLLAVENLSFPVVSRLLQRHPSQNVVARRPPTGEPEQDIVITAHLDSAVVSDIRNVVHVRLLFLGMLLSCLALAALSLALLVGAPRWVLLIGLPCAAHLAICTGIMLHQAARSPVVAGAGDNASGVAALLQAARQLPPLTRSTVWFVATGAEEPGLVGAISLLGRHPFDRSTTWFINVDMVAAGKLRTASLEGMLLPLRADPDLLRIAAEEAQAEGFSITSEVLRAMSTDGCVPLIRGYRTVSLSSSEGHWHLLTDTVENVSPDTLAQAAVLLRRMIHRLDAS